MKAFRALCLAAAMGLVVASALPQGHRGNDGGSGPSRGGGGGSSSGGGQSRGGGSSDQNRGGGGSSGGGQSRGGGSSDQNRGGGSSSGDQNRGGGGHAGGGGVWPGAGQGGHGGPSNTGGGQDRGGGQSGGGTNRGGGSTGDQNRGNGGAPGRGDGGIGRGGGNSGSGNSGGGTGSAGGGGSTGGPGQTGSGSGRDNRGRGDGGGIGTGRIGGPPTRGGTSDFDLGRKGSHSGNANYQNSNNVASVTKVGGAVVIGRAPVRLDRTSKRDLIRRKDHPVLIDGGLRVGYYFYDSFWCDNYFWYPYYNFDPFGTRCCVSPWYYYPMLPPYVAYDRCHFYNLDPWAAWQGNPYQWQRPAYYGNYDYWGHGRGSEVDYAVDDIVNAFERDDRRAAGRLISRESEVAIYVDGNYSYTLNADDFYDMFMDATQNVKTKRYEVLKVENNRDSVRVTARHTYLDPWGNETSVEHFYELRYEGANLVISKFGVSGGR